MYNANDMIFNRRKAVERLSNNIYICVRRKLNRHSTKRIQYE